MANKVAVVVWEYEEATNDLWIIFEAKISNFIEQHFINLTNNKHNLPLTLDALGAISFQQASVDFSNMTFTCATSSAAKKTCAIKRSFYTTDSMVGQGVMWQWSGDVANEWFNYNSSILSAIEKAFKASALFIDLSEHHPKQPYVVDFKSMAQLRKDTGYVRPIRRLVDQVKFCKIIPMLDCSTSTLSSKSSAGNCSHCSSNVNMPGNNFSNQMSSSSSFSSPSCPSSSMPVNNQSSRASSIDCKNIYCYNNDSNNNIYNINYCSLNTGSTLDYLFASSCFKGKKRSKTETDSPQLSSKRTNFKPPFDIDKKFTIDSNNINSMTSNNIINNTNINDSINNNAVTTNNSHFNSNSINNLQTHSSAFNNNNNGCDNLYNSNTNNISNSSNIKTNNTPNRTILSLNVNNLPLICFNQNIAKQSNNTMLTSNNVKNDNNSNIINDIANVSSNIGNNNSSSNNGSINNIINQNADNRNTLCFPPSLAPIGYISTSSPSLSPVVTPISFLFPHQRQLSMFKRANRRLSYMDHVCNSIFNSINRCNNIKKINIVADNISSNTGSNDNNARDVNNINHRNFSSNNNNINNHGLNSNNNFIDSLRNINSINKICSNVNDDNNVNDVNQSVDPNSFEYLLKQDFIFPVKVIPNETCCICCDRLQNESSYANETQQQQQHHEQQQSWSVVFLNKCHHHFHLLCLKAMYEAGTKHGSLQCPHCKHIYGVKVGNCPPGRMVCVTIPQSLPGYEQFDTLYITYNILSGVQEPGHPNPGKKYSARGFPRCGYLPNNKKGQKVLRLLVKAWNRRLTFTIGTSVTTGESNTVVWNEIHHKTEMLNKHGHGYPDANYLDNVISELASQGVIDDDADDDDAEDTFLND